MAITTSKVTYSLKPATVDRVQELSVLWGVPKSEVIRRAVEQIPVEAPPKKETPLEVFLRIQRDGTGMSPAAAAKLNREIMKERRAWGRKRK